VKALVTGSAGHLGEGLVRTLRVAGAEVLGLDVKESPWTACVGSIVDRRLLDRCMKGVDTVFHTAALHKPHVVTHSAQAFVDTNVSGTLALLEAAAEHDVRGLVFTSTTSVYGDAVEPVPGGGAVWTDETLTPRPKNIYGVTKLAAEGLCALFHRNRRLNTIVLRTSRFFPEEDDDAERRAAFDHRNAKVNELLYRRADLADVVSAHLLAAERAPAIGWGLYVVSATTPFTEDDLPMLTGDAPTVVERRVPGTLACYRRLGWKLFDSISRVYVNTAARQDLGWQPEYDFARAVARLEDGLPFSSPLSEEVGAKGYHDRTFDDGPYPTA